MLRPHEENRILLFEGAWRAIPFNVFLGSLLAIDLFFNQVPLLLVFFWLVAIALISFIRWFFCRHVIKEHFEETQSAQTLSIFVALTLLMGTIWGAAYWLMLPYLKGLTEFTVILVLGGMCAGSIASLSSYLPAYHAYIIPMFAPIIGYNFYLFTPNRVILAMMFALFILMLLILASLNHRLLNKAFELTNEKEKLINKLQQLSITDPLTGLYNRRHFNTVLQQNLSLAKRNHYSLTMVLIDVDDFKQFNDRFGHLYGDKVLIETAKQLKTIFKRTHDTIFRFGGDEFCLLLVNQTLEEVSSLCHFLCNLNLSVPGSSQRHLTITLSTGILPIPVSSNADYDALISAVDKALYNAKQTGKAKMVVAELRQ